MNVKDEDEAVPPSYGRDLQPLSPRSLAASHLASQPQHFKSSNTETSCLGTYCFVVLTRCMLEWKVGAQKRAGRCKRRNVGRARPVRPPFLMPFDTQLAQTMRLE